jgi:hypothetical protein
MKGLPRRPKSPLLSAAFALAALAAPAPAGAQGYPSPYGYYPPPPNIETPYDPDPGAMRERIAATLARLGYRLVGPLRDRGDEIFASGVDATGQMVKFVIDAGEGEVLRSWPVESGFEYGPPGFGRAGAPHAFIGEGEFENYGPRPLPRVYVSPDRVETPDGRMRSPRTAHHHAEDARSAVLPSQPPRAMKALPPRANAPLAPSAPERATASVPAAPAPSEPRETASPAPIQPRSALPSFVNSDKRPPASNISIAKPPVEHSLIQNETAPKSNIGP